MGPKLSLRCDRRSFQRDGRSGPDAHGGRTPGRSCRGGSGVSAGNPRPSLRQAGAASLVSLTCLAGFA